MPAGLTIGALARATGTSPETIRWYERAGLMPRPERTSGNYRVYTEAARRRLLFIRRARDLGFGVEQVRALMALSDDGCRDCADIDRLTRDHLQELDERIADLTRLRRALRRAIGECRSGAVADCRILQALQPERALEPQVPSLEAQAPSSESHASSRKSQDLKTPRPQGLRRPPRAPRR